MRLLCDRSVLQKYIDTFERTDWLTVMQSEDVFSDDAPDREISEYAAREGWVVFTEDDDFQAFDHERGLILYHHIEQPSPGDVVAALRAIADAYDEYQGMTEHVPDGWI
jgi:hypothetical protein